VTSTSIHKSSTDGPNKNMNPSLKRTGSLILDNKQVSGHIPASSIAIPQKTGLTVKETESFSLTSTSFEQHICAACSCENDIDAVICIACSNVLKPELMRNHWQCESDACQRGSYINAGDYGLCQVCGARRPISSSS
jgi:ribosomal protein L40E